MCQDLLPSGVPSYLATPGQGLQGTYEAAQEFFKPNKPRRRRHYRLTVEPKAAATFAYAKADQLAIALVARSAGGVLMKDCWIEPAQVGAVIDFINSSPKAKTPPRAES